MLFPPTAHAENPPDTWTIEKLTTGVWALKTANGVTLETFSTRRAAETAKTDGFLVRLYNEEAAWYAGETMPGRRSFADCAAEPATKAAWAEAEAVYA